MESCFHHQQDTNFASKPNILSTHIGKEANVTVDVFAIALERSFHSYWVGSKCNSGCVS